MSPPPVGRSSLFLRVSFEAPKNEFFFYACGFYLNCCIFVSFDIAHRESFGPGSLDKDSLISPPRNFLIGQSVKECRVKWYAPPWMIIICFVVRQILFGIHQRTQTADECAVRLEKDQSRLLPGPEKCIPRGKNRCNCGTV